MDGKFLGLRGWDRGSYDWLYTHGMMDENTLLVGGGRAREGEHDMIAKSSAAISVHADVIMMGGQSEVRNLMEKGVTVALGIDGPVIAYQQNLWYLIRHVSGHPAPGRQALANPAGGFEPLNQFGGPETALEMATTRCKALRWDTEIGSLEVGKQADLLASTSVKRCTSHRTPR